MITICFIPAIIAGAGALAGGIAGGLFNRGATAGANKTNIKLAREQMQFEERMVKEQNEYNSPANQMARYAQAGLNPNLVYQQGNSGNQTSVPSYNRADVKPATFDFQSDMAGAVNSAFNAMANSAEIRKTNADAQNKELQNSLLGSLLHQQTQTDMARLVAYEQFFKNPNYFLRGKELQNLLLGSNYELTANRSAVARMYADWMNSNSLTGDWRPNYLSVYNQSYDYKQALLSNQLANLTLIPFKQASLVAGTNLKNAQTHTQKMMWSKIKSETDKLNLMNKTPEFYYGNGSFLDKAGNTILGAPIQELGNQVRRLTEWIKSLGN